MDVSLGRLNLIKINPHNNSQLKNCCHEKCGEAYYSMLIELIYLRYASLSPQSVKTRNQSLMSSKLSRISTLHISSLP